MYFRLKLLTSLTLLAPTIQIFADMYVPSLPFIQNHLQTSVANMQISISLFMLGLVISQLASGSIADFIGPKKPIMLGLILAIIGSIFCYYAEDIIVFNLGRCLQGTGVGCASLYRAILFREFSGRSLKKNIANLSAITILCLASAPLVGSYLQKHYNWQACFLVLSIYASINLICIYKALPLTKKTKPINLQKTYANFSSVIKNKVFLTCSTITMLNYFSIIAWVSSSPFILQNYFQLSVIQCGQLLLYCGIIAATANLINGKIHIKKTNLIKIGTLCQITAGFLLLTNSVSSIILFISYISLFMFGLGLIFPNCYQIGLQTTPAIGTANALMTSIQSLGGILGSAAIAYLSMNYILEIAAIFIINAILINTLLTLITKKST